MPQIERPSENRFSRPTKISVRTIRRRALRQAHGDLDEELAAELKRPWPDSTRLQNLKRRKSRIKDEIFALDQRPARTPQHGL